jgi:NAD(P)-dependent dehydrogenase (short-subunit alcohol dehydrogenase family)
VTGASYGVGRGVAEVLGECGATVYVTGRSTRAQRSRTETWSVDGTADIVTAAGGTGIPVAVDHADDEQVHDLFAQIEKERGRLDLLVNNVWQWGPSESYLAPTWEQPSSRWDAMFGVGVRGHFVAIRLALPLMLAQNRGLIVSTQERPGDDHHFGQNMVVDTAAVAMQRMVRYLAHELRDTGLAALLVYLGWVRTVNMGMGFDSAEFGMSQDELVRLTQSPYLIGRAIAMLAADPQVVTKSGQTLYAGDVAREYGFTDIDGRVPRYEGGE